MEAPSNPPNRIEASGEGIGEISRDQIEDRAAELARMEARDEVNDADRARAAEELQGPKDPSAPETGSPDVEEIVTWDEPVEARGEQAPRIGLEDEASVAEQLVEEGVDEADHDRRVAASEQANDEGVS